LHLALRHPNRAAVWLGRPCQYVVPADWRGCETAYWTDKRFSEDVIAASNSAIDQLKSRAGARQLIVVGYSGGGAVAALIAARRNDVIRLVTVAGNLDHREWTRWHAVAPLQGSLNPIDFTAELTVIPQTHWVGGRDTVVGRRLADAFAARFPLGHKPAVRELQDADHFVGWIEHWPELLEYDAAPP
jgi:pimeloyl-ACP methyl ester carboxylesterase